LPLLDGHLVMDNCTPQRHPLERKRTLRNKSRVKVDLHALVGNDPCEDLWCSFSCPPGAEESTAKKKQISPRAIEDLGTGKR
jgi:hypothetical protein